MSSAKSKRKVEQVSAEAEADASAMADVIAAPALASSSAASSGAKVTQNDLSFYYTHCFPYQEMYNWLSYGDSTFFSKREISFTLEGDIYVRYQSFDGPASFRRALETKKPIKIDIGAVFTEEPSKHGSVKAENFRPVAKEMIFDIDINDYDDVRFCCSGAKVCPQCWSYMSAAIAVLNDILRNEFGLKQIMFVFSGRRGVHCWVCDDIVLESQNEIRASIADFIQVFKGSQSNKKKIDIPSNNPLYIAPFMNRIYTLLEPRFVETVLEAQGFASSPDRLKQCLQVVSDDAVRTEVQELAAQKWKSGKSSMEIWVDLASAMTSKKTASKLLVSKAKIVLMEVVFSYMYPRLDINVSKQLNHLLKSPFCLHPSTGKVCVPIDPATADEFDPNQVPTVQAAEGEYLSTGKQTILESSADYLRRFVSSLSSSSGRSKSRR